MRGSSADVAQLAERISRKRPFGGGGKPRVRAVFWLDSSKGTPSVCGQIRTATDKEYTIRPVPQRQKNREPTAGVEPATPALRERCSDHLSYVGIGLPHRIAEGLSSAPAMGSLPGSLARMAPRPRTPQICWGERGLLDPIVDWGVVRPSRPALVGPSIRSAQGDAVGSSFECLGVLKPIARSRVWPTGGRRVAVSARPRAGPRRRQIGRRAHP
jgi:hypothetical protein